MPKLLAGFFFNLKPAAKLSPFLNDILLSSPPLDKFYTMQLSVAECMHASADGQEMKLIGGSRA